MMKSTLFSLLALGLASNVNGMKISQEGPSPPLPDSTDDVAGPHSMLDDSGEEHVPEMLAQTDEVAVLAQTEQRSSKWFNPINVVFQNNSSEDIELFWFDYFGNEVSYGVIAPGGTRSMRTFATHPWRAEGNGLIGIDGEQIWTAHQDDNNATIVIDDFVYRSTAYDQSITLDFKNKANMDALISWHDYSGNLVYYKTLAPFESYAQQSYVTHPWSATGPAPAYECLKINEVPVYVPDGNAGVYIDNYRSVNGRWRMNLTFDNDTDEDIELWWHDYQGDKVSYGTIGAGQTRRQGTYVTHPWSATGNGTFTVDNLCVYEAVWADSNEVITIRKI